VNNGGWGSEREWEDGTRQKQWRNLKYKQNFNWKYERKKHFGRFKPR